ncbi:anthocyanidin 3-O-glucoside 6''-O-acyltransferase-like [Salvia hispanica]|uniref:anthocyanidin 3-O-glucoside 6''-O-acyltransferase-like n=1 Tax=Salvia hispanica TaxID=49212 RepID=UPI002009908D|nr:anthocyanidin 3-O-glucoside 6''-O-acyltransferase-like [Salvia hispanica]
MAVKIVESHSVSPSSGAAAEHTLPLLYFDIIWFDFVLTKPLFFYALKCSQSHFLDTILVNLKHSLSLTLKHFLPLASKIIFPLTSSAMPVSRYTTGDSLSLVIATSDDDFSHVVSNHPKPAADFHQLVAQMPAAVYSSDEIKFSALAIQLTLFPNQGICIGFTHHHSICDATTLNAFLHMWASINNSNVIEQLPFYGRDSVQDSTKLTMIHWDKMKTNRPTVSLAPPSPSDKVRATFHLSNPQIEKLKRWVAIKKPSIGRPSSFVVACAYLWSCLAKSEVDKDDDDETQYLCSPVNCRGRLDPPLPENYFGNCSIQLIAASSHGKLKGNDGFVAAAEAVAGAVKIAVKSSRVSEFYENRSEILSELKGKRVVWVAGSTKVDQHGADYGWGRAVKYECIHTDFNGAVHLCKGRQGGIDMGFSMPKPNIFSFASIFNKYLFINSNL